MYASPAEISAIFWASSPFFLDFKMLTLAEPARPTVAITSPKCGESV